MESNTPDTLSTGRWSRMTLRLPPALHSTLTSRADEEERPRAEVVRTALRAYLGPTAR